MLLLFRSPIQDGNGSASATALASGLGLAILPGDGVAAAVALATATGLAILPGDGQIFIFTVATGNGNLLGLPITYYFQADMAQDRTMVHGPVGGGTRYRHAPPNRGSS